MEELQAEGFRNLKRHSRNHAQNETILEGGLRLWLHEPFLIRAAIRMQTSTIPLPPNLK